jgi:uncharacterized protein YndB with AHSA1/START domain
MGKNMLRIEAAIQVLKSPAEVFEAIADPAKMSNYFISKSTGRMEEGKTVTWKFPEFDISVPVRVVSAVPGKKISFYWDSEGGEHLVEIKLTAHKPASTVVTVTEKEMEMSEAGIKWLSGNTMGWANFLACLKAWLEYGINLRKGAFDFMKDQP